MQPDNGRRTSLQVLVDRWRPLAAIAVLAGAVLSAFAFAIHERRESDRLRKAFEALQTHGSPQMAEESVLGFPAKPSASGGHAESNGKSAPISSGGLAELELQGARLLIANDYSNAIAHYAMLSRHYPNEIAFTKLLGILRAKLDCTSPETGGPQCR
jgi:hypothetical protein